LIYWSKGLGELAKENNYTKQQGDLNHRVDRNTETGLETEADAGRSYLLVLSSRKVFFNEAIYSAFTFVVTIVLNSDTSKNEFTNLLYDHFVLIYVGHSRDFVVKWNV
jgi:hypothetical protein